MEIEAMSNIQIFTTIERSDGPHTDRYSLADAIDPLGSIPPAFQSQAGFILVNNHPGPQQGLKVHIFGNNLTYGTDPSSGSTIVTGGTITGITIEDEHAPPAGVIAQIDTPSGDTSAAEFWTELQSVGGAVAALDNLLSGTNTVTGSTGADKILTHASAPGAFDTVDADTGDDLIICRTDAPHILIGCDGDDTFECTLGNGVSIYGSELNGDGGDGENNTILCDGVLADDTFAAIFDINTLQFKNNSNHKIVFTTDMIGLGLLSPTLFIDGAAGQSLNHTDTIVIRSGATAATNVDLDGWVFGPNFTQTPFVQVILSDPPLGPAVDVHVVGSSANNYFFTGSGNDT